MCCLSPGLRRGLLGSLGVNVGLSGLCREMDELSALRWMAAGVEFSCGVPGGEGHRRCGGCVVGECGIGAVVDAVE